MSDGVVVQVSADDSVRITDPRTGRSLQVPARAVLAADRVLRHCHRNDSGLSVEPVEDADTREAGWQAWVDEAYGGVAATPWAALLSLAAEMGGAR